MKSQKHLFQIPENEHYLNCSYMAPLLRSVEEVGLRGMEHRRYPAHLKTEDFFQEVIQLKKRFAELVHVSDYEDIAILPSASYGMACAINNVCPKKGGHALILEDEFPSGRLALERWCEEYKQELKVIGPGSDDPLGGKAWNQHLLEAISTESSLLVMSSVHWMNGIQFDMTAIGQRCAETRTLLIVDGTQSVGAVPLDVDSYHIDALICAGYKWLMGPYTVALAYFSEKFHQGRPLEESWRNRTNAQQFSDLTNYGRTYMPRAGRYDMGEASNFILIPMQSEALRQVLEWTPEYIQSYARHLMQPLYEAISLNGQRVDERYQSAHILGVNPPQGMTAPDFSAALAQRNIRTSLRGSYVRVSAHLFNDAEDIRLLTEFYRK